MYNNNSNKLYKKHNLSIDKLVGVNVKAQIPNIHPINKLKNENINLKNTNRSLSTNYNSSLKMIIDISNLLERYNNVFSLLDKNMKNIEESFKYSNADLNYIKKFTDNNFKKLNEDFNKQTNNIIILYNNQGLTAKANNIKKLKNSYNKIYKNNNIKN